MLVASVIGCVSNKSFSTAEYNASKAGVHHLTRSSAGEGDAPYSGGFVVAQVYSLGGYGGGAP